MIETRMLNAEGTAKFLAWLQSPIGASPPPELLNRAELTDPFEGYRVDPGLEFTSRYEFGAYLNDQLANADFNYLLSPERDGLWAWLALVYFAQLSAKGVRRAEHYVVLRKGSAGSLAYRHAARTPYELVHIHGGAARICLMTPMPTLGDMTEQLASRQTIAHNRGFFRTAANLYLAGDKLRRGAASKPKKVSERKAGDRTGFGSVRRLALALQRLDLTFDTEEMDAAGMRAVLPKEFSRWGVAPVQE
jgi:hypothetical protein